MYHHLTQALSEQREGQGWFYFKKHSPKAGTHNKVGFCYPSNLCGCRTTDFHYLNLFWVSVHHGDVLDSLLFCSL